ncbi:MAG: hypothetical protein ABTQ32_27775 [Myxococcaceae bacterium]
MAKYWVVDTNLLVDWCIFNVAETYPAPDSAQTVQRLQYLPLAIYRDFLVEKLRERKVTTSHIVAAETGWVGHRLVKRGTSHQFLQSLHRICHQHEIAVSAPNYERVSALAQEAGFGHGHPDASLVVLSQECSEQGHSPTILTGEQALASWCAINNVSAERFEFNGQ